MTAWLLREVAGTTALGLGPADGITDDVRASGGTDAAPGVIVQDVPCHFLNNKGEICVDGHVVLRDATVVVAAVRNRRWQPNRAATENSGVVDNGRCVDARLAQVDVVEGIATTVFASGSVLLEKCLAKSQPAGKAKVAVDDPLLKLLQHEAYGDNLHRYGGMGILDLLRKSFPFHLEGIDLLQPFLNALGIVGQAFFASTPRRINEDLGIGRVGVVEKDIHELVS